VTVSFSALSHLKIFTWMQAPLGMPPGVSYLFDRLIDSSLLSSFRKESFFLLKRNNLPDPFFTLFA
jgi:hypothetical protein